MNEDTSIYDAVQLIAPRLEGVLKRHRARYDFQEFCQEIIDYIPDFEPKIFQGISMVIIVENTQAFFENKKTTWKEMRKEFFDFLKEFWADFIGEDPEEVCNNMKAKLHEWNHQNPQSQFPMINWLPDYGGVVSEQTPFPSYRQLAYMQENGIPYTGTGEQVSFRKKNP
jgi:hypothetical protein